MKQRQKNEKMESCCKVFVWVVIEELISPNTVDRLDLFGNMEKVK